jgi:hypothetical protein
MTNRCVKELLDFTLNCIILLVCVRCTDDDRIFFRHRVNFYPKTVGDEKKKAIFSVKALKAGKTFGPS